MGQVDDYEAMEAAVERVLSGDPTELPGAIQRNLVGVSARVAARVLAADARLVSAYEGSKEWAADGHRHPTAALRAECNQSTPTAAARVKRARKLRHLPHLLEAVAAGEVTTDALDVLLRADRPGLHEALVADEKALTEAAIELEHPDLVAHVQTWCDVHDPDDAERRARRRDDERSVHASTTLGSQVRLDGWLTPTEGAEFLTELQRREQVLFEADWADARARRGDRATTDDLTRTPAQRRHDALVEMARRSAAYTGSGPATRGRAVVNVVMDYETFIAELARHTGQPFEYPTDRTCQLVDGTVITPAEALNLALAGEVRRVVIGADGHILDFGRSRRLFTPALAEAIALRDRRCTHAGCLLPADKCETDHIREWQHGGGTDERNGQAACRFHNRWKTNNPTRDRQLRRRTGGRVRERRATSEAAPGIEPG